MAVDVYIFSPSINWTLSSWLMCSQSLLDLDQLGSSRVKTTGVRDGRRERKRQGSRAAGSSLKNCQADNSQCACQVEQRQFEIKMLIWKTMWRGRL